MDNMLLEKYASMMQKQAYVKAQQEYGMEKQALFGALGKGVNLLARGVGKATKWGANALQSGAKAIQQGIGRAGNWAQHAGAAADNAIMNGVNAVGDAIGRGASTVGRGAMSAGNAIAGGARAAGNAIVGGARAAGDAIGRGASALGRGALAAAKNPWVQGAAAAVIPGYGLYKGIQGVHGYMQEHDNMKKQLQAQGFQQPSQQAPQTSNYSDQLDQLGGTMGNMPVQQPAGLPPGIVSSINYNPIGQFGQFGQ